MKRELGVFGVIVLGLLVGISATLSFAQQKQAAARSVRPRRLPLGLDRKTPPAEASGARFRRRGRRGVHPASTHIIARFCKPVTFVRIARLTAAGADLSCAMLDSGTAARWDRYWRGRRC